VDTDVTAPPERVVVRRALSRRVVAGEPLGRLLMVALALLAVTISVVVPTALRVHGLSVFDEGTHADYAWQVAHGHIPAKGSIIAAPIRAEMACRGAAESPGTPLIGCGNSNPPLTLFGAGAQDYNFGHPPLYYAITGIIARALNAIHPGHFITFARLVGVGWLFAALIVMYFALRRFRVAWPYAAGGAALLALTPAIFYMDATVTNDAAAALSGALALLTAARIAVDGKLGWVTPAILAGLTAATKILNAVPYLALAGVLLIGAVLGWRSDRARSIRLAKISAGIVVAVGLVYGAWTEIQNHRGVANWVNPIQGISSRPIKGLPFDELFSTSFSGLTTGTWGPLPPLLANNAMVIMLRLLGPLVIGCAVALLATQTRMAPRFVVGATALLGLVSYPLLVEIQVISSSHRYFPVVIGRYGTAMIVVAVACIALLADQRRLNRTFTGFVIAALGVALYTTLGT
jgi:hypothetical protein